MCMPMLSQTRVPQPPFHIQLRIAVLTQHGLQLSSIEYVTSYHLRFLRQLTCSVERNSIPVEQVSQPQQQYEQKAYGNWQQQKGSSWDQTGKSSTAWNQTGQGSNWTGANPWSMPIMRRSTRRRTVIKLAAEQGLCAKRGRKVRKTLSRGDKDDLPSAECVCNCHLDSTEENTPDGSHDVRLRLAVEPVEDNPDFQNNNKAKRYRERKVPYPDYHCDARIAFDQDSYERYIVGHVEVKDIPLVPRIPEVERVACQD
eukprot:6491684-Amphidinium_carterae.7